MNQHGKSALDLSPKKRELFERLLQEAGIAPAASHAIPRRISAGPAPLSFAQQRLWFLEQLVPDNPFYNIFQAVRFGQAVDVELLERSLNEIVRRHEALRTRFVAVEWPTHAGDWPI